MKVGAHPLVVAVALGFLGPHALAEDEERCEDDTRCAPTGDDNLCATCGADLTPEVQPEADEAAHAWDVQAVESAWTALVRDADGDAL